MITYGTNPGMGVSINQPLPDPASITGRPRARLHHQGAPLLGLEGGKPLAGHPIDVVFIGSRTNSRISGATLIDKSNITEFIKVQTPHSGREALPTL